MLVAIQKAKLRNKTYITAASSKHANPTRGYGCARFNLELNIRMRPVIAKTHAEKMMRQLPNVSE